MAALNTWEGCRGEAQSRKPLDFTRPGRQREAMAGVDHDLVLAGGGLAAGLVALAFRQLRPEVDVAIVEQGPTIGGNHLWSFFDSDVQAGDRWLVDPLVAHRWTDNEVCFPDPAPVLSTGYHTILSDNLHERVKTGSESWRERDVQHV